jgi:hypothetical protein
MIRAHYVDMAHKVIRVSLIIPFRSLYLLLSWLDSIWDYHALGIIYFHDERWWSQSIPKINGNMIFIWLIFEIDYIHCNFSFQSMDFQKLMRINGIHSPHRNLELVSMHAFSRTGMLSCDGYGEWSSRGRFSSWC